LLKYLIHKDKFYIYYMCTVTRSSHTGIYEKIVAGIGANMEKDKGCSKFTRKCNTQKE